MPIRSAFLVYTVFFASFFMIFGCAEQLPEEEAVLTEETEEEVTTETTTTSIDISVGLPSESMGRMLTALGTVEDIESVHIVVRLESDGTVLAPESELTETPEGSGTWMGTVSDLPVYQSLMFEALAYDSAEKVIFTGTVTRELSNGASAGVILEMQAVDDDTDPDNPKIVSMTVPSEISAGSVNNAIIFKVDHSAPVEYTLSADRGTITSPTEGILDPMFDLEIGYDAPTTAGSDSIRISIHDPELSDTISTEYTLNIVEGLVDGGITVIFGPAITAMHFLRTENALQISSETVPATGLIYEWQGNGSFNEFSAMDNPITIENFSNDDSGVIELTVTDENGIQTSISRSISTGDFPYNILVSETPDPVDTVLDIASLLLWQDDVTHPFLTHDDAEDYCLNSFDAGGYNDWRLPTRKELKGLYLRRNILTYLLPYSYWTSESSRRDQKQAWYRAFGWGFESIKKKTHYSFVRCVRDWQN